MKQKIFVNTGETETAHVTIFVCEKCGRHYLTKRAAADCRSSHGNQADMPQEQMANLLRKYHDEIQTLLFELLQQIQEEK